MDGELEMADHIVEFDDHGFAVFSPFSQFAENDYRVHFQT